MKNNIRLHFKLRTIIELSTYSILFLMLFVPFEHQFVKAALLIFIIVAVTTQAAILGKANIDKRVLIWCLIFIIIGIFFILWGTLNGYTDSIKVLPVYVIYPISYIFIIGSITRIKAINNLYILITFTVFLIAIYSMLFTLSKVNIIPAYAIFSLIEEASISFANGFIAYDMPSITSMLYLVPFTFSALLLWNKNDNMPIKPIWLYIILIFCLVTIIFTSRRIFWILLILTPVFTFTFIFFLKRNCRNNRKKILFTNMKRICLSISCIIAVAVCICINEIIAIIKTFESSIVFVEAATFKDEGTTVRGEQLRSLLEGWSDAPLLGAGHGASLPAYHRSVLTPWAFELSYPALLFQTGLLGFFMYFFEILWIFYMGLKLSRENEKLFLYIIPALVGMTCFLIANGSNPYLQAFDHLWTIFIPLILINFFLLQPSVEIIKND